MGTVKLKIATPLATETAILFLYGKKPQLTEENVASILELSEFLLIPNLKSTCVSFLKTVQITEENCMKLLDISSRYDFELTKCDDFIKGHLREVLQLEEATRLTKDSVMALLRDPYLSYLTPEEKFTFAAKWANGFERNNAVFPEVFDCISLVTVSAEFLETVVLKHPLVIEMRYNHNQLTLNSLKEHRMLIVQKDIHGERIACFDLDNETWHGIDVGLPKDMDNINERRYHTIDGVLEPSGIYRIAHRDKNNLVVHDLISKSVNVATVSAPEKSDQNGTFLCFCGDGTTFLAVSVDTVKTTRCRAQLDEISDALRPGFIEHTDDLYYFGQIPHRDKELANRTVYIESSTIYSGQLQYPETIISPILTLHDAKVASVCMNAEQQVALLTKSRKTLFIYDISNCQLDVISIENHTDPDDRLSWGQMKIAAHDNGFVLYTNKAALSISRLTGPSLTETYTVQKVNLEYSSEWQSIKYFYSNGIWIRFLQRSRKSEIEFSSTTHDEMMNGTAQDLNWKKFPYIFDRIGVNDQSFMIKLPRSMLTCHFNCPHCEQQKKQQFKSSTITEDMIVEYLYGDYGDDSDEANYGHDLEDSYDDYNYYSD